MILRKKVTVILMNYKSKKAKKNIQSQISDTKNTLPELSEIFGLPTTCSDLRIIHQYF